MAARKTGLGRGLDGLFPSYINNNSDSKSSDKASGKSEKESSGKKASAKADKAEKAVKAEKSDKKDGSSKSSSKKSSAKAESKNTAKVESKTAVKEAAAKAESKSAVKEAAAKAESKSAVKETAAKTETKTAVKKTSSNVDLKTKKTDSVEVNSAVSDTYISDVQVAHDQVGDIKVTSSSDVVVSENKTASTEFSSKSTPVSNVPVNNAFVNNVPASNVSYTNASAKDSSNGVLMMRLSSVEPNREQPRKVFDEDALQELAESVKQYGIIQPIIVQKRDDYYEIIAGERRWRAAKLAGLKEVPVVVRDYTDREIMEVSLIENIQREDLNPIEEAKAYQRLMQEYELKQEEVASRVAKSRSAITNSMRLLKLDERVQQMLIDDKLSSGHARAILAIQDTEKQYEIALKVCELNLSVRDVEKLVKELETPKAEKKKKPENTALKLILQEMETKMNSILGTKVTIHPTSDKKGKIEINYFSNAELERIYDLLREIPMQIDHISGEETV